MVKHATFPEKGNPYETLNLPNLATSIQIKKKFRELSLKFHPDKRKGNLSAEEIDALDKQFIAVQEAKSFLLDGEYEQEKEKYDAKLKSEALRKEEDKRREAQMDGRRKRMRSDLERKIEEEMLRKQQGMGAGVGMDTDARSRTEQSSKWNHDKFEDLKRDGMKMRETYHERKRTEEAKSEAKERKRYKKSLESRQVRVKWSRKKMGGQSEHMLAKLLSRFGEVQDVEMIGSKGNAALVTFHHESSCKPCVDAYLHSEELRATFVGKDRDDRITSARTNATGHDMTRDTNTMKRERDRESVEERKLRQAAEREALLRQMEMGGDDIDETKIFERGSESAYNQSSSPSNEVRKSLFPPHFPSSMSSSIGTSKGLTLLQRLGEFEIELLKDVLPLDEIKKLQQSAS